MQFFQVSPLLLFSLAQYQLAMFYRLRFLQRLLLLPPPTLRVVLCALSDDTLLTRRHEGVEIMTWSPNYTPPSVKPSEDISKTVWHNGLDVYLQSIFRRTHKNYIDGQMLTENFFSSRRFTEPLML